MRARNTQFMCYRNLSGLERLEDRLLLSVVPPTVTNVTVSSTQWSQSFFDYLEASSLGDNGYSIPVGAAAQLSPLSWVNLDTIQVSFSADVQIDATDLSLSGIDSWITAFSGFHYDPSLHQATWTLASNLAAGRYLLEIDANGIDPVRDLSGRILDGEWTDGIDTYESGDGVAGGDFEFGFNVLPGDSNASGNVGADDLSLILGQWNRATTDPAYILKADLNGDGVIQIADLSVLLSCFNTTIPNGTPAGRYSDAPSTAGLDLVAITNRDLDTTVALDEAFADLEGSALTYSISNVSCPELFDSISIDPQTGILTLNAVGSSSGGLTTGSLAAASSLALGRSVITITATDGSGASVSTHLTVDIDYENQPPIITDYLAVSLGENQWALSGTVSDSDDDVEGLIVEFSGVFAARATVAADGTFYLTVNLPPTTFGWEFAETADHHGATSNTPDTYIGLT